MNWYRIETAFIGLKRLATLPEEDKQACIAAYKFFQRMQAGERTDTEDETRAVAAYYKVLNNLLSVFDLEKLYIPPMLDETKGLYDNQLLCERAVLKDLNLKEAENSHLLDMGCGRGRIAYHFATLTGGEVSGYNIDPNQIENAVDWAARCGMSDRLHFKVGDHHEPLEYESDTFEILLSAPSRSEAWPLCEQKSALIRRARTLIRALEAVRLVPPWVEEALDLLQRGGQAWNQAERAKIADLNWRIVAEKR